MVSHEISRDPSFLRMLYRNFDFVEKIGVDLNQCNDIYEVLSDEVPRDNRIITPLCMVFAGIEPIIIDMGINAEK